MKQLLMTLMMVAVMVVSVSTVKASHPTLQNPQGYGNYGNYGSYGSYGSYGGFQGDSDAGKMIAVGQLARDLAGAASSLKSTWEAWDLAQKEQERRNQGRTQPAQAVYSMPSVNQGMIAENTNLRRENQMLRDRIEQEKAKEVQKLKQENEVLEQKLKDAEKNSQEKIQQISSENQTLKEQISKILKKMDKVIKSRSTKAPKKEPETEVKLISLKPKGPQQQDTVQETQKLPEPAK